MAGTALYGVVPHRSRGIVRTNVAITCDASGVLTALQVATGHGRLVGVAYDGGLDASAVITVTDTKTGAVLLAYTTGTEAAPVYFRPTAVVTTAVGVAVSAADTAPNVNRDIFLGGKVSVAVASGGTDETCVFSLIVDEVGLGEVAITV